MVKYIVVILMFTVMILCGACSKAIVSVDNDLWTEDYAEAIKLATENNKIILLDFTGSDWCVWCQRLDKEVFSKQQFIDYAEENLILCKIDFPKNIKQPSEIVKQNATLAKKYGIRGYPTIILIDKDEQIIDTTGYKPGGVDPYIKHLTTIIEQKQ